MIKKVITLASFVFVSSLSFSQTLDQLKKENKKLKSEIESSKMTINDLKAKVDFCNSIDKNKDASVKSFTDNYDVKILKCKGNKSEQSVSVELLISQSNVNQSLSPNGKFYAYDAIGNVFEIKELKLGITNLMNMFVAGLVPTNTPVKLYIKFSNVLPGTATFSKVIMPVMSYNFDGAGNKVEGAIEIKNLSIEW